MRTFVAAWPPDEVRASLAALERPDVERIRWTMAEQWHVTLRFLGEVEDPADVGARLREAPMGAGIASLGPRLEWLAPSMLVVPVAGLDGLAGQVVAATAAVGAPPERRRFRGHLTVARARRGGEKTLHRLPRPAISGSWVVDEVTVVVSHQEPGGSRYEVVDRIPLVPAVPAPAPAPADLPPTP